jgi:hypothetical protein
MINDYSFEKYGKKTSWLNSRRYTGIFLEGFTKTTEDLRVAGLHTEI